MHFVQHGHILDNGDAELTTWIINGKDVDAFDEWRQDRGYFEPDSHLLVPAESVPRIREFNEANSVSLSSEGGQNGSEDH